MKKDDIHTSGKRKRAIARCTLRQGSGIVKINNRNLLTWGTALLRMRVQEPLLITKAHALDFFVTVRGGGAMGQADAVRLAIGRALAEHDAKFRQVLLDYDRMLLVADVRRKEAAKPNHHGKARAATQKSYR